MTLTVGEDGTFVRDSMEMAAINAQLGWLQAENYRMTETLANVELMIDEKGWTPIYEYGADQGLTLGQVKRASRQLRELVVGNPTVGQGAMLRTIYTWGGGVDFSLKNLTNGNPNSLTTALVDTMQLPANQRYLFSASANEEFERCAFTDGTLFILGDKLKKTVERVPISQICGDLRNPTNLEEIWAYRRVWYLNPDAENESDRGEQVAWYFTDIYDGPAYGNIQSGLAPGPEPVDRSKTMIDIGFNKQIGWAYGVPDSLAIIAWAKLYKEFLVNGYVMSRALAKIAYKVTTTTVGGGTNASATMTTPGQAGSTVIEGNGNSLVPLTSAGKGYDFGSGRALAGQMAAGLGVGLGALLADAEGDTPLDGPSQLAAATRRRNWDDGWRRIFAFFGNSKKLVTTWHDLPVDQLQRQIQAFTLANNTGLFKPEPMQRGFANALQLADPGPIPDGYMIPNNVHSQDRLDVDADGNPVPANTPAAGDPQTPPVKPKGSPKAKGGTTGSGGSNGGNGQGKSTGTGKSPNDHSTD